MAIIGAGRLGEALERHGTDYTAAFQDYHDKLKAFVDGVQDRAAKIGMAMIFPADQAEIATRNQKLQDGELIL